MRSKLSDQLNEITALVPLIENAKWAELGREMTSPAMQEFNLVLSRLALDSPELQAKAKATKVTYFLLFDEVKKKKARARRRPPASSSRSSRTSATARSERRPASAPALQHHTRGITTLAGFGMAAYVPGAGT